MHTVNGFFLEENLYQTVTTRRTSEENCLIRNLFPMQKTPAGNRKTLQMIQSFMKPIMIFSGIAVSKFHVDFYFNVD